MKISSMGPALALALLCSGWSGTESFADTGPLEIRAEAASGRYTFYEGDAPVLTYPFGAVPVPAGVSGPYAVARSDYVHPLYGPNGKVLTADYAHDHPHHRGLYWAWPEVTFRGETRDLHALQGVFARPEAIRKQELRETEAELVADNLWLWGDETPIARETVTLRVGRADRDMRVIDFHLRIEALQPGVTLARRNRDAYGGFNVRLSARANQQIVKHVASGGYPWPSAWAELTGVPPGGDEPVGIFILQSPANPEYPGDWVDYPDLNWLQPTFPSTGTAYPLDPVEPLELEYRLIIRWGAGLTVPPAELFAAYSAGLPGPLANAATYRDGQDRSGLTAIEERLRDADASGRRAFEAEVLERLTDPSATGDFKRWACSQLVGAGSEASVPMAARLLADDTAWMQATDVLMARPGDAGINALRTAFPDLAPDRRASILHRLGIRRDARTVSLLSAEAGSSHPEVAAAALEALGETGTVEAARVLAKQPATDVAFDACLRAAGRLAESGQESAAGSLYSHVWSAHTARPWQRAAALVNFAGLRPHQAAGNVQRHLTSPDRHLRNGAARALLVLDASTLAGMRPSYATADTSARLALLNAWATRQVRAAEPEFLHALGQEEELLKVAALRGLRDVGSAAAMPLLLDTALQHEALARESLVTLSRIPGAEADAVLVAAFDDPDPARAALAIEVVGLRRPPGYLDGLVEVLGQDRSAPAREAVRLFRDAGAPAHVPALRAGLFTVPAPARAREIALALAAICLRQDDPRACLAGILDGEPELTGAARVAMLAALPAVGGDRALDFATTRPDAHAVRALVKWPDADAVEPLLDTVRDRGQEESVRKLAAGGLVSYARRVLPEDRQVHALQTALGLVKEPSLRAGLLKALAELATVNLARGKPVTGSNPHQGGNAPALAVDGDPATFWGCGTSPTSLTVDLETVHTLDRVRVVTYHADHRYYQYHVEVSEDGRSWVPVADMRANTTEATEAGIAHRLDSIPARYLKVTMLKNSANPGMHIAELEAYITVSTEETEP